MKRWTYALSAPILMLGLAACSDDPSVDNNPKEQVVSPDEDANDNEELINKEDSGNKSDEGKVQDMDEKDMMDKFPYTNFDLNVEYGPDSEYEAEYEEKNADQGDYEAEIIDTVNDKKLKGVEAFQTLYTLAKDLELDENTSDEDAIKQVLDTFQLDDGYHEFDLEYTLKDGSKKEVKDNK